MPAGDDQQSAHDGHVFNEILCLVGPLQTLLHRPEIMHDQADDQDESREYERDFPLPVTGNEAQTATELQGNGQGQKERDEDHAVRGHILGRAVEIHDFHQCGHDEVQAQQDSPGEV